MAGVSFEDFKRLWDDTQIILPPVLMAVERAKTIGERIGLWTCQCGECSVVVSSCGLRATPDMPCTKDVVMLGLAEPDGSFKKFLIKDQVGKV